MPLLRTSEHVDWIAEEIAWFDRVDETMLGLDVPTCPGWDMEALVNHMWRGLGTVWVELLRSGPDIDGLALYRDAPAPRVGPAALEAFGVSMASLVAELRSCEPDEQCWWFAGSVPMSYLAWLGATELSVHRADAALVIGGSPDLAGPRARDALELSCRFMPNVWTKVRQMDPPPPIRVCATDSDFDEVMGTGDPTATVRGTASDLRLRLWGRPAAHQLDLVGDISAFEAWAASSPTGPID